MTKLSLNINKIATIRNARGGNIPDVIKAAEYCQIYGADGITVHPRPDERHIRYQDVRDLRKVVSTEFNIEGYPSEEFLKLVTEVRPEQVTMVPDPPDAITSSAGWDTKKHKDFLKKTIKRLHDAGIRTSIFIETNPGLFQHAAETGTNRVELYTEPYAAQYPVNRKNAAEPFVKAAEAAEKAGLELNAGHDLNLENLRFFAESIPSLKEVSIGHALISDALYYGLKDTIRLYKNLLQHH